MRFVRTALVVGLVTVLVVTVGCAGARSGAPAGGGPGFIYTDSTYPATDTVSTQYNLERKDFDPLGWVHTDVQSGSILGWIATGDAGYRLLYDKARTEKGADDVMDVRVDMHYWKILGIVSKVTNHLHGMAVKWK